MFFNKVVSVYIYDITLVSGWRGCIICEYDYLVWLLDKDGEKL